ncbi:MAG: hypothetical protein KAJ51_09970, partial [Thermoplasmata archaeon]|nr:hypothetical protein [Thermoplasmata archaeon]
IPSDTISNGKLTFTIELSGYSGVKGYLDTNKATELILRQFQCLIFSNKDNLNHPGLDILGATNAKKGDNGGIMLGPGAFQLNDGLTDYPTKNYIDSTPNPRYRASIVFFKDESTPDFINLFLGSYGHYECDISHLKNGVQTIEMGYDATNRWQLFISGIPQQGFNPLGLTTLYPKVEITSGCLEVLEVKNQVFTKIDSTVNWSQEFNDSRQINVADNTKASNNITHSIASSNREVIYVFNNNLIDIGNQFEDLYLWADLDYGAFSSQSSSNFDPKYKSYVWNPPTGIYYRSKKVTSVGNIHEVILDSDPYPPSGYDLPSFIANDDEKYIRGFAGWTLSPHYTYLDLLGFESVPWRPYIDDISVNYKYRVKGDQPGNVISILTLGMERSEYTYAVSKWFDFYIKKNKYYYKNSSADPFIFSEDGYFKNAISYTDDLDFDYGKIVYTNDYGPLGFPFYSFNWLDLDWLQLTYSLSTEP